MNSSGQPSPQPANAQPPASAPPASPVAQPAPTQPFNGPPASPVQQQYAPKSATVVVITEQFSASSQTMQCPHCGQHIQTLTEFKPGTLSWALCILLTILGCWCGCCLIPFYAESSQDVEHLCPHCRRFLGVYKRC